MSESIEHQYYALKASADFETFEAVFGPADYEEVSNEMTQLANNEDLVYVIMVAEDAEHHDPGGVAILETKT